MAAGLAFALSPCLKKRKNRLWIKEWHKCANTHLNLMGDLGLGESNNYKYFFVVKWSLFDELHMIATLTITKRNTDMQE